VGDWRETRAELQKSQGMGESTYVDAGCIQINEAFPEGGNLWADESNASSAASIGANIAEGTCRNGDADFARFLQMAAGSASELEYHLILPRYRTPENG
jgi:hypothetical protein